MRLSLTKVQGTILTVVALATVAVAVLHLLSSRLSDAAAERHLVLTEIIADLSSIQALLGRAAIASDAYKSRLIEVGPGVMAEAAARAGGAEWTRLEARLRESAETLRKWGKVERSGSSRELGQRLAAQSYIQLNRTLDAALDRGNALRARMARDYARIETVGLAVFGLLAALGVAAAGLNHLMVQRPVRALRQALSSTELRGFDARSFPVENELSDALQHITQTYLHLRRTHRQLVESERRLRDAERIAHVGNWRLELATGRITWSDEVYNIFGVADRGATIHYNDFVRFIPEEERGDFQRYQEAALTGTAPLDVEHRILRPDGAVRMLRQRGQLIRDEDGTAHALQGVVIDLTDMRVAQQERAAVHERLETLVTEANIGIFVHVDFTPVFANRQLAEIFGYRDPAEILALDDCRSLFAERERARLAEFYRRRLSDGGAPAFYEVTGLRADGAEIELENRAFLMDWNGQLAVCSTLIDVTARKKAEREAAEHLNHLAQVDRVSVLGEMAASIVHEITQPLTAVGASAGAALRYIRKDPPNIAAAAASLERVQQQTERTRDIISRIRGFVSRSPAAAGEGSQVDVRTAIDDAVSFCDVKLRQAAIELRIRSASPAAAHPVPLGRTELGQVLVNLLANAADAIAVGASPERLVEIAVLHLGGDRVAIRVSDTGCGLPADMGDRIFLPFETSKPEGTGLGLSVCRSIVEAAGGSIHAASREPSGSVFQVELPLVRMRVAEDAA